MLNRRVIMLAIVLPAAAMLTTADEQRNMVAANLCFLTHPFGAEDPYSWSFGGGLAYERRLELVRVPILVGGRINYYDSRAMEDTYGTSGMLTVGAYGGVPWTWDLDSDSFVVLTPVLGLTWYRRWFEHLGGDYTAIRPVVIGGAMADMHVGSRVAFGVAAELELILDRAPVFAVNQTLRLGYRF